MNISRKKTRQVKAGSLPIGGDTPVSLQTMTSVPLSDVPGTIAQIERLKHAGADLVRIAVLNEDLINNLKEVRRSVDMPLAADVHFNHRIAIKAIESGINKVRINPGNIGSRVRVKEIILAAKDNRVAVRIGVNGGSLDRQKYPVLSAENLVQSAMEYIKIFEDMDFFEIIVSLKSSDLFHTIEANRMFSSMSDYPLHLGLSEAGLGTFCTVQSSVTLGHLLLQGIGDTIRVSMTGDPVQEVTIGKLILESLGLRERPIKIISCPTCGRTNPSVNLLELAERVEKEIQSEFASKIHLPGRSITVAVMGCEVNGPGEAGGADAGIALTRGGLVQIFSQGKKIKDVHSAEALDALKQEIRKILGRRNG